eukprot:gene4107-7393_t
MKKVLLLVCLFVLVCFVFSQFEDDVFEDRRTPQQLLALLKLRCAFSCVSRQDLSPFVDAYDTCKKDLECYQPQFDNFLKSYTPCFEECLSVSRRGRRE